jgi:two-component system, sensor histidine kinase and response regulator
MSEHLQSRTATRQTRLCVTAAAIVAAVFAGQVLCAHWLWDSELALAVITVGSIGVASLVVYYLGRTLHRESARDLRLQRVTQMAALQVALDAGESAQRAKSRFLANISHEVRTPMNGILGMTQLLLASPLTTEQQECARVVRSSAETLLAILDDVLDVSRIESGRLQLSRVQFDLVTMIEEIGDLAQAEAQVKSLQVGIRFPHDAPRYLLGDPVRVRQILVNLVNNAVKFTPSGSIMIGVEVQSRTATAARIELSVHDTGIGIRPDVLPRLFGRFEQADDSTTRIHSGAGLGLTICKQLADLMGGTIEADSELGKGTTFRVILPFELAGPVEHRGADCLGDTHVLVICDQQTIGLVIEETVSSIGVNRVFGCSTGDALRMVEAALRIPGSEVVVLIDAGVLVTNEGAALLRTLAATRAQTAIRLLILAPHGWDWTHRELSGLAEAVIHQPMLHPGLHGTLRSMVKSNSTVPSLGATGPAEGSADECPAVEPPGGSSGRILVVDDLAVNQLVARRTLESLGYEVTVVADGRQAVDAVGAEHFDLVLMDCSMPVMDGYEATRAIRAAARHADTPIVAMTAHVQAGERERCLECGMDDYMSKPLRAAQLREVLTRFISSPSTRPA